MNTLVPGFTKNLMETVRKEKELRTPENDKVILTKDIAEFLKTQNSYGMGKPTASGHLLKAGRQWPSARTSRPYQVGFKAFPEEEKKKTAPEKQAQTQETSKMKAEESSISITSYVKKH